MAQTPVFLHPMQHEGAILLNMYLCFFNIPDPLLNTGCAAALLGFILRAGGGGEAATMRQEEAEGEKEMKKIN